MRRREVRRTGKADAKTRAVDDVTNRPGPPPASDNRLASDSIARNTAFALLIQVVIGLFTPAPTLYLVRTLTLTG